MKTTSNSAGVVRLLEVGRLVPPTRRSTAVGVAPVAAAAVTDAKLEAGFKRLGLSVTEAKIAAQGRDHAPSTTSLFAAARRLGHSPASARIFAAGRSGILEAATKTEVPAGQFKGGEFPASDYAYVPDSADPSGWELLLTVTPGGTPDPDSVKAAVLAIDSTSRAVLTVTIPEDKMAAVVANLAKAWRASGLPVDEMPEVLTAESLRAGFARLGISSAVGLRAAVRGRPGRRI